jgi:hypothetical protein
MNERIKELMKGCFDVTVDSRGREECTADYAGIEKFAKLILQDCIEQCQGIGMVIEATYDGEEARRFKSVANSCTEMIKRRFFTFWS